MQEIGETTIFEELHGSIKWFINCMIFGVSRNLEFVQFGWYASAFLPSHCQCAVKTMLHMFMFFMIRLSYHYAFLSQRKLDSYKLKNIIKLSKHHEVTRIPKVCIGLEPSNGVWPLLLFFERLKDSGMEAENSYISWWLLWFTHNGW